MAYIGKIESGHAFAMSPRVEMIDVWNARVYWKREADGVEELAYTVGSCDKGIRGAKERLQRKLDETVRRYADYAKHYGIRYEVKQREKHERELAKRKAASLARQRIVNAAPDLLAALKAMLAGTAGADELAKAAIHKATEG